ncbi:M50 family peptidase [Paenibacillaceae bacterium]|nr:M50 family peptidase [Paenibacillaceae bacterium]
MLSKLFSFGKLSLCFRSVFLRKTLGGGQLNSWIKLGLFLIVSTMLTRLIPFSSFFRSVDTLVHEMAHAMATLLLSGKVMYIHLFADQSGVTYSTYTDIWKAIPIALAGYMGASLFTLLLFRLYNKNRERQGLLIVAGLAILALVLFVRNSYGMIWCAGFAALTILVYTVSPGWLRQTYYLLIAFICLVESVISSFVILSLAFIDPAAAGDAANLSKATAVPAFVWGLCFTAFSLWCAKLSIGQLFKRLTAPRTIVPKS